MILNILESYILKEKRLTCPKWSTTYAGVHRSKQPYQLKIVSLNCRTYLEFERY